MTDDDDVYQSHPRNTSDGTFGEDTADWERWIGTWEQSMPIENRNADEGSDAPAPSNASSPGQDGKIKRKSLVLAGVAISAVLVIAGGAYAAIVGAWSTSDPEPVAQEAETTSTTAAQTTTSQRPAFECEEYKGTAKLVTSHGGPVTSPETLVAEFQHRYFDLRDGAAVADLWDTGYDAAGFQSTIDSSLAAASDGIEWCVTVMPAETGWWATEVSWWETGDVQPRETWYGNYRIEQRGSEWIFTEADAGDKRND